MAALSLRACVALLAVLAACGSVRAQNSTTNPQSPFVQVTLKEQLEKGLKCRRPVEFEFVDNVTKMVNKGKLPVNIVNASFAWSRRRNNFRPFVYFQRSLIELAKREGITLSADGVVTKTTKYPAGNNTAGFDPIRVQTRRFTTAFKNTLP